MPRKTKKRPSPDPVLPEGYTYRELEPLVRATLEADVSVLLRGHPGVGKSALAADLSADMGLPLIDIRLAQREPAELGGVYFPDREREQLSLLAPPWVRQACEAPALVFLDEINAAVTRLHQAAAYQIVLERRVGPFRFHPGTRVLAAGNLDEDQAIVAPLSSALLNRFAHFVLRPDVRAWLDWAVSADVAPEIVAYFRAHERVGLSLLYDRDGEDAFPSPRAWAMASRVYRAAPPPLRRRVVSACVGAAAADRFFQFERVYSRISPERVVVEGKRVDFTAKRNADPSFLHAAVTAVATWIAEQPAYDPAWNDHVIAFLRAPGVDLEYAFLFLRDLKARAADALEQLKAAPAFRELAGELVGLHAGLYA
jgi:hypothetical protein